jgi:general secretion pathway protein M
MQTTRPMQVLRVTLPEGRAGQALALAITVLVLLCLGAGVVLPVSGWSGARRSEIARAQIRLAHERAVVGALPALRRAVAQTRPGIEAQDRLLRGASDAVAGAALQGDVQALAGTQGVALDSAEILAARQTGRFRLIPLKVSLTTPYPKLIALLGAIAHAKPRMLVDDLDIDASGVPDATRDLPVHASLTVAAFRAGAGP